MVRIVASDTRTDTRFSAVCAAFFRCVDAVMHPFVPWVAVWVAIGAGFGPYAWLWSLQVGSGGVFVEYIHLYAEPYPLVI